MLIPFEVFDNQFRATIQVNVLPSWRLRAKMYSVTVPSAIYRSLTACNGRFSVELNDFCARIEPELAQLWHRTPRTERPSAEALTVWIYNVCVAHGIEIGIGPSLGAHGTYYGGGKHP